MEKTAATRKQSRQHLRRRYKRYAAAIAGAAIVTGALLPGIPTAKAEAAANPLTAPVKTVQAAQIDKDSGATVKQVVADRVYPLKWPRPHRRWHEHNDSWPAPDENQILYKDGHVYYRSDNDRSDYAAYLGSPVDFVKARAADYGFDASLDSFTLLSLTGRTAVVQVQKHDNGSQYNVVLTRDGASDWNVVELRAL